MVTQSSVEPVPDTSISREDAPREMARQICNGFVQHDRRNYDAAVEAFEFVDRLQFRHIDSENLHLAATAFVDALWAKDDVEIDHLRAGTLDRESLREADWSPVRKEFRKRAALLGIDQEYAKLKTEGWRQHKLGGDYWTPFQEAQILELRAALQKAEYPRKPKEGQSGPGPEALRYVLGVELHDMHTPHHWKQAEEAMTPYFEYIVSHHENV